MRLSIAVIAATSVMALSQIASAADLPRKGAAAAPLPPPPFSWTGCYVGGNAGWGRVKHDLSSVGSGNINTTASTLMNIAGADSLDNDGFTGGGQLGCNWQAPTSLPVVLGLEGDYNWIDGDTSRDAFASFGGVTAHSVDSIGMSWFATFRGRLGLAFDRILVYGTFGGAFTQLDVSKNFAWSFADGCPIGADGLNHCHVGGASSNRTGWTAGAGVEWAFFDRWSVKAEYLYANFGDVTYLTHNIGPSFTGAFAQFGEHRATSTLQVVRLGLNYKFW
jgi:outer membrane immunogenic protein